MTSTSTCPECGGELETPSRGLVSYIVIAIALALIVRGLGWGPGLAVAALAALVGWYLRGDSGQQCAECGWEPDGE